MNPPNRPATPPPDALIGACRRLLRPLVRLLLRAGVTWPVLSDMLRTLFVEVALDDLLTGPKSRTDSRVSLLTGVHRKEIRRLRELPADAPRIPETVTVATQIIARWLGLREYTGPDGAALPLARSSGPGGVSFDALVESVTTDVRPRAVLDDWLSQGLVTLDGQDRVCLNAAAFLPRGGGQEQMFYFGRNLHDHIAAAADNVSSPGAAPFFDRAVHYDQLDDATARSLEQVARTAAQDVLLSVNRTAIALTAAMPDPDDTAQNRSRVNFGIFVYRTTDDLSAEDPEPS